MKKIVLLFSLFISLFSFSQIICYDNYSFESNNYPNLSIDSSVAGSILWQIGKPNKFNFNQPISPDQVIVTDTVQPYPINANASFTITTISCGAFEPGIQGGYGKAEITGWYFVNSDSLNDYGLIEISFDKGSSWVNLLEDSIQNQYVNTIPDEIELTGNSNDWVYFQISFSDLGQLYPVQFGDTILYRFSFHSDNQADSLPGLMFDELYFEDHVTELHELDKNGPLVTVSPNPSQKEISISSSTVINSISILNLHGQILDNRSVDQKHVQVDLTHFPNEILLIRIHTENGSVVKRVSKQ